MEQIHVGKTLKHALKYWLSTQHEASQQNKQRLNFIDCVHKKLGLVSGFSKEYWGIKFLFFIYSHHICEWMFKQKSF